MRSAAVRTNLQAAGGGAVSEPLYSTVYAGEAELVEKKSRFIGEIRPVEHEEEAKKFLAEVTAKTRDATHHVYCYLVREQNTIRFSDDGEPQGTAGRPALEVLTRAGVTDCCLVITRYFGGTLLGANGLVRAYAATAAAALKAGGICDVMERAVCVCRFTYADWARVEPVLRKTADVVLGEPEYAADVAVTLELSPENVETVERLLQEKTAGRAVCTRAEPRCTGVRRG